jgi:hypothetical protein
MDTPIQVVNAIRSRYRLTDAKIAKLVESNQPTVWRIRSGKTKDCSADLYRKLCVLREKLGKKSKKLGAGDTAK